MKSNEHQEITLGKPTLLCMDTLCLEWMGGPGPLHTKIVDLGIITYESCNESLVSM